MKSFIVENTWKEDSRGGWGNGYVAIPTSSSWHGVHYDGIPVDVHGGLTWSSLAKDMFFNTPDGIAPESWVVGFHTYTEGDESVGEGTVRLEADLLLIRMTELDKTPYVKDHSIKVRCPHCQSLNDVTHLEDEDAYPQDTQLFCCFDCHQKFHFSI